MDRPKKQEGLREERRRGRRERIEEKGTGITKITRSTKIIRNTRSTRTTKIETGRRIETIGLGPAAAVARGDDKALGDGRGKTK